MQSPPISVAHVDAEREFSGGEAQVFLLIEGLRRAGVRNVLFAPPGSQALAHAARTGVEHVAVAMRNEMDLAAVLELRSGFRELGIDLVHLHTGRATWLGGWAARWAGVPAITTRRMDRDVRPGWRTRMLYERLTRRSVAISESVAGALRGGGVSGARIRTIWSSVDVDVLPPSDARHSMRAELGFGKREVVAMAAGSLVARKRIDVLLRALAELDTRSPWRLMVAGDGPEAARLARLAEELDLAERVRFLGRRADIDRLLAAADLFVMPSQREGLGVATLEAMRAGLPIVATAVGGLAQVVVDRVTGLLVPPGDIAALAVALEHMIEDPGLRKRCGEAGRERVRSNFRAETMVESYDALYREVLAEARR